MMKGTKFDTFPKKNAGAVVIVWKSTTIYTFFSEADQWGAIPHKCGSRDKLTSRLIIKFAGDTHQHSSHSQNMQTQMSQVGGAKTDEKIENWRHTSNVNTK